MSAPPDEPAAGPKWQFSLRTMLIALTLFGAMLAPVAYLGWFGLLPVMLLVAFVTICYTRSRASLIVQILSIGAILLLLAAVMLPPLGPSPIAGKRMACSQNLKQIALAMQLYHLQHGHFPPAYVADESGTPMLSWRVLLLPFLQEQQKFDAVNLNEPWNGPNNSQVADCPSVFHCPADTGAKLNPQMTSYVVVTGPGTAFPEGKTTSTDDFRDGTTKTILVVEVANSGIHWMEPRDLSIQQMSTTINAKTGQGICSDHQGVAIVALADGQVKTLPATTSAEALRAMLTIRGGEWIEEEF